jgi:hypothetical protein
MISFTSLFALINHFRQRSRLQWRLKQRQHSHYGLTVNSVTVININDFYCDGDGIGISEQAVGLYS